MLGFAGHSLGWLSQELRAVLTALLNKRASQGLSGRKTAVPGIQDVICGVKYMQFSYRDSGLGLAQCSMGSMSAAVPALLFFSERAGIGCAANTALPLGLFLSPCVPVSCISLMGR